MRVVRQTVVRGNKTSGTKWENNVRSLQMQLLLAETHKLNRQRNSDPLVRVSDACLDHRSEAGTQLLIG